MDVEGLVTWFRSLPEPTQTIVFNLVKLCRERLTRIQELEAQVKELEGRA